MTLHQIVATNHSGQSFVIHDKLSDRDAPDVFAFVQQHEGSRFPVLQLRERAPLHSAKVR